MKSLYADLQDSGEDWNRPCLQISEHDTRKSLAEAANDYAMQCDRVADLHRLRGIRDEEGLQLHLRYGLSVPNYPLHFDSIGRQKRRLACFNQASLRFPFTARHS